MRIIKNKNVDITNVQDIENYVMFKEDDYLLNDCEEDITNLQNIELLYSRKAIDYKFRRRMYKYLATYFWNALDNNTKEIATSVCAAGTTDTIVYYMTVKRMKQIDAQYMYIMNRATDIVAAAACCKTYIHSPKFVKCLLTYFPVDQVEALYNDTQDLVVKYENVGHFGQKYGDKSPGLLDFIESYGAYEKTGLNSYKYNKGMSYVNLRNELIDILYLGYYK